MKERRHFTRIVFSTPVQIKHNDAIWQASLIDLSLKGALLSKPQDWVDQKTPQVDISFSLADSDVELSMTMNVVHEEPDHLGLRCEQIDIDSVTHLKRLIELNIGNSDFLDRELEHLIHPE